MKKETRREFMKTTLAGTGAAAIGPLVVPAGAYAGDRVITGKKDATMQTIEYGCDVAVVGGGPGGLASALAAARQGAKVLLVDRNGYLGGNLTMGLPILGWLAGSASATGDLHGGRRGGRRWRGARREAGYRSGRRRSPGAQERIGETWRRAAGVKQLETSNLEICQQQRSEGARA
jgi:hypothetical protein